MHNLRAIAVSLALTLAMIASTPPWARAQNTGILGVWWTENNKGRVEIVDCAAPKQGVCGRIIWISQPNDSQGRPQTDKANKNPNLRKRAIIGLPLFEGWRPVGVNRWKGEVYDPEEGETYDVDITLAGDKLTLRGCVLFICDSDTWTRYRG